MNNEIRQIAYNAGIKIDAFGSPVVDHERMLQEMAVAIVERAIKAAEGVKKSEIRAAVTAALGMK